MIARIPYLQVGVRQILVLLHQSREFTPDAASISNPTPAVHQPQQKSIRATSQGLGTLQSADVNSKTEADEMYVCGVLMKCTVLVKSFAHLMLWIFCDPPERGGLTLNMVICEYCNPHHFRYDNVSFHHTLSMHFASVILIFRHASPAARVTQKPLQIIIPKKWVICRTPL